MIENFVWGPGGQKITTPEQAARRRKIAEALIGQSATPAKNWGEGIADVAAALSGTVLQNQIDEQEAAAMEEAGALFGGLSSASSEADLINALSNPWLNDGQRYVAQTLFGNQFAGMGSDNRPANVQEWEYFNALSPDDQTRYINMKRSQQFLNLGDRFAQPNPANPGETISEFAIDSYGPAYDSALGAGEGKSAAEVNASLASLESKMPGLQQVADELYVLADKATYTTAGKLWDEVIRETGNLPTEGAVARTTMIAMIDNQVLPLLRDTFGAAFTKAEGDSLRATLSAPDKTPAEKKAVLNSFIEQKKRDLAALQAQANRGQASSTPARLPAPEDIQALTDKWLNQ
jgi:hypothetical protein